MALLVEKTRVRSKAIVVVSWIVAWVTQKKKKNDRAMGTAAVKWASCFLAIITQMLVIYQKEESGMLGTTWILKLVESFSDE